MSKRAGRWEMNERLNYSYLSKQDWLLVHAMQGATVKKTMECIRFSDSLTWGRDVRMSKRGRHRAAAHAQRPMNLSVTLSELWRTSDEWLQNHTLGQKVQISVWLHVTETAPLLRARLYSRVDCWADDVLGSSHVSDVSWAFSLVLCMLGFICLLYMLLLPPD